MANPWPNLYRPVVVYEHMLRRNIPRYYSLAGTGKGRGAKNKEKGEENRCILDKGRDS